MVLASRPVFLSENQASAAEVGIFAQGPDCGSDFALRFFTFGRASGLHLPGLTATVDVSSTTVQLQKPAQVASTRIPTLDGLRGLAILLVLLWHGLFSVHFKSKFLMNLLVVGRLSWSGVDLFFVLSGFLIGGILLDAKHSPRYYKTFYIRRGYRILPLYGVIVGICVICHQLDLSHPGDILAPYFPIEAYLTLTQNFWMAAAGVFGSFVLGATWSLAIEEQFYMTVPLVIRNISRTRLLYLLVGVILTAPLLRTLAYSYLRHGDFAAYVLPVCRADALCLGVLLALVARNAAVWQWVAGRRAWFYSLTGGLVVPLAWLTYHQRHDLFPGGMAMAMVGYSLLACFFAGCLLISLTDEGAVRRFLQNGWLMELGTIAYGTYLLHLPIMEGCRRALLIWFLLFGWPGKDHSMAPTVQFVGGLLGIAMTLVLAKLSWRFFEKPMLQRGHLYKY